MTSTSHRHPWHYKAVLTRPRLFILAAAVATLGIAGGTYRILTSKDAEDHLQAAEALMAKGDRKGARIELKNALQQAPDNAEARYRLGQLYFASQEFPAAEKELKAARSKGYRGPDLLPMLARTLIALREPRRLVEEIPVPEGATHDLAAALLALRARAQFMLGDGAAAEKALQEAMARRPGHPEVLMTRAQMAVSAGQADTALALVEQAIAADGRRADLWVTKGDLQRIAKKREDALAAYRKALDLEPGNLPARLASALIHLDTNALDQAAADLKEAGKDAPDNLMVRYLGALIDFRRTRYAEANGKLQQVMKAAPDFLPGHLLSGAVSLALGNRQSAISHLNRVIAQVPDHAYARKLLATAMIQTGQLDRATELIAGLKNSNDLLTESLQGDIALRKGDYAAARQHLEKASELAPENPSLLIELAKSRIGSGDTTGAIEALNKAAEIDTASARADVLLVHTHLKAGRYSEATAVVDRLEKERPRDPLPHNLRGIVFAARKDPATARVSFGKALEIDPAYLPAATNLARLDLQANDPKAARSRFEKVLGKDPKNSRAWLALASLSASQKNEKDYLDSLTKAKQANPKDPLAYTLLARYWLGKQDAGKALSEGRAGLDATGRAEFYEAIGMAHIMQGGRDGALQAYSKWVETSPDNPVAHFKLAQMQHQAGDTGNALKSLDKALALAPDLIEAAATKSVVLADMGHAGEALKMAVSLQQKQPKSPAGFLAEAEILAKGKKLFEAGGAFAKAAQLARNPQLAIKAYQAYAAGGQVKQGVALLNQWLSNYPSDVAVRHMLASALLTSGNLKEAAKHYSVLLDANPKDLTTINNLAWIFGELKDSRAIPTAEMAYKLSPENPRVLDTFGWILVNNGKTSHGLELIKKAQARAPDQLEIQWHLAAAYAKSGDKTRARNELANLLGKGMPFPQEPEARQLLTTLN